MPPVKILVAGASGLIGREAVRIAKERGHWVRTLSRDPRRAVSLEAIADDVRTADATDPKALAGICDGIDVVVSAVGAPVSPNAKAKTAFADVDRAANLALLAEAERAGARRFVYVGVHTGESYADTAYVRAHTDVEDAIRASKLECCVVRPTGVFGAFGELLDMARKGPLPVIGGGAAQTNPVHEADVAEAVIDAAESPAPVERDIGGPETLTRRRIAELAFEALGKRPFLVPVPVWAMRMGAWLFGLVNQRAGEFLQFIVRASTCAAVAPSAGKRELGAYLNAIAKRS